MGGFFLTTFFLLFLKPRFYRVQLKLMSVLSAVEVTYLSAIGPVPALVEQETVKRKMMGTLHQV